MIKRTLVMSVLTSGLLLAASSSYAAGEMTTQEPVKVQLQAKDQVQKKEQIYGSQMMTSQERTEQRKKMRAAKTTEERERIRAEHHEAMKIRAQERASPYQTHRLMEAWEWGQEVALDQLVAVGEMAANNLKLAKL